MYSLSGRSVRRGHQLHRIAGQAAGFQCVLQDQVQRGIGMGCFLAAAENDGVAALDRQTGRIDGDVRARFVEKKQHAERHADLANLQPVGARAAFEQTANWVGQRGNVAQSCRSSLNAPRRELQAIDLCFAQAELAGSSQVLRIRGHDRLQSVRQCIRSLEQPAILERSRSDGKNARRGLRAATHFGAAFGKRFVGAHGCDPRREGLLVLSPPALRGRGQGEGDSARGWTESPLTPPSPPAKPGGEGEEWRPSFSWRFGQDRSNAMLLELFSVDRLDHFDRVGGRGDVVDA